MSGSWLKSLVVFAPSYAIACDCLRVDHGIDPRHPALVFIDRADKLLGRPRPIPMIVADPCAKRSLDDDSKICRLREHGIIRDWTEAERAAVSLRKGEL
jgi:hypothetical protein